MSNHTKSPSLAKRLAVLAYGLGSYGLGVASLLGLILYMLGVFEFTGGPLGELSLGAGLALDFALLFAFALQHSVMARKSFKERWTRLINPAMERATYVLATAVCLVPMLALWQPMSTTVWSVESPMASAALTGIAVLGWAYLFVASFAINHFELFGVQQVVFYFLGRESKPVPFRERWMYRFDRHPIMTGMLIGLWVTPHMTAGHAVFALGCTLYLIVGVYFEERALRRQWGAAYDDYCRRVGTIVPGFGRNSGDAPALVETSN